MSDPALLAAFDAMYPQDQGHKPPTELDLVWFKNKGHRVGDTPENRRLMEEGPRRPVPPPPPVPAGVRDPSEPEDRQPDKAEPSAEAALAMFAAAPPPTMPMTQARRSQIPGEFRQEFDADPEGEILPGFEEEPGLDLSKQIMIEPEKPPEGPVATDSPQPTEEDTMSTLATEPELPLAPPAPAATPAPAPAAPAPAAKAVPGDPFQDAEAIPRRLKLFMYGPPGAGKTIMSLHFPGLALVDLERGTDHYGGHFKFRKLPTTSLAEINDAVRWLITADHEYRTLVVDPLTIYWDMIQTKWADYFGRAKSRGNPDAAETYTFDPKDWKPMKDEFKEFLRLLSEVDMNVICTAHEKKEYSDSEFMKPIGQTFDCEKHAAHFFDTVGRIFVDGSGRRVLRIQKDRTNRLPIMQDFPAEYAEFEKCLGADDLARKATPASLPAPRPQPTPQPAAQQPQRPASTGGNGGAYMATDQQIGFLRKLVKDGTTYENLDAFLVARGLGDAAGKAAPLTKSAASALIDELKAAGGAK